MVPDELLGITQERPGDTGRSQINWEDISTRGEAWQSVGQ